MTTPFLIISDFVKRQTTKSIYSSFHKDNWQEVLDRTMKCWDKKVQGYRDGVFLVPIDDVTGFYSSTCILKEGDKLFGEFRARQKGEMPRKSVFSMGAKKAPASKVDIVVYRRDVLAEGKENTVLNPSVYFFGKHESPFSEYEIISINASLTDEPEPMSPGTLMANHFHIPGSNDGGTTTGMTDKEFVDSLRKSFEYWKDKTKCGG